MTPFATLAPPPAADAKGPRADKAQEEGRSEAGTGEAAAGQGFAEAFDDTEPGASSRQTTQSGAGAVEERPAPAAPHAPPWEAHPEQDPGLRSGDGELRLAEAATDAAAPSPEAGETAPAAPFTTAAQPSKAAQALAPAGAPETLAAIKPATAKPAAAAPDGQPRQTPATRALPETRATDTVDQNTQGEDPVGIEAPRASTRAAKPDLLETELRATAAPAPVSESSATSKASAGDAAPETPLAQPAQTRLQSPAPDVEQSANAAPLETEAPTAPAETASAELSAKLSSQTSAQTVDQAPPPPPAQQNASGASGPVATAPPTSALATAPQRATSQLEDDRAADEPTADTRATAAADTPPPHRTASAPDTPGRTIAAAEALATPAASAPPTAAPAAQPADPAPAPTPPQTAAPETPAAVAAFDAAQTPASAADVAPPSVAGDDAARFTVNDGPLSGLSGASLTTTSDSGLRAAPDAPATLHANRNLAAQLASHINAAAISRPSENRLELRLDPPELGRVEIEFTFEKDAMKVVVRAEREEALDLMRRHSDELARELEEAGLRLGDLAFAAGGFAGRTGGDKEDRAALENLRRGVQARDDAANGPSVAVTAEARAALGLGPGRVDLRL